MELTDGHSGFCDGKFLYLVDGDKLLRIDESFQVKELVAGLTSGKRMSFASLGSDVFWCNGSEKGRISGGEPTFWGVPVPKIKRLGVTSGSLRPGRYLVGVTGVQDGVVSGALPAVPIDLTSPGAIVVDAEASTPVDIYVSDADGRAVFWVQSTQDFPATVPAVGVSTSVLDLFDCAPPPVGHIVREFRGRVFVAVGDTLFFSMPLAPHLFRLSTDFQQLGERIVMMEPLTEGLFVATASATYWIEGSGPEDWRPRLVDRRKVAEGPGLRLSGRKLEGLNAETVYRRVSQPANEVVVWMTEDGPAFGLAGGQVQMLFDGQVAMEQAEWAALGFRELNGVRQVLMSLQRPTENVLAASDRVTCTVIKADAG